MKLILLLFSIALTACKTMPVDPTSKKLTKGPPPPVIKAFSDSKAFMLVEELRYSLGDEQDAIVVPKGFVTDFASVPKTLWSTGLSPHGKFSRAAIIHDYLYWSQVCTRAQADTIMLRVMEGSGVTKRTQFTMYQGVNIGGVPAWDENRADRDKGMPRIIPEQYQNFPANLTWDDYERVLVEKGVTDPVFVENPSYCRFGNSGYVEQLNHFLGENFLNDQLNPDRL